MTDRQERLRAKIVALKSTVSPPPVTPSPARLRAVSLPSFDMASSPDWHHRILHAAAERRRGTYSITSPTSQQQPVSPSNIEGLRLPLTLDRPSPYKPVSIPKPRTSNTEKDKGLLMLHDAANGDTIRLRKILAEAPETAITTHNSWTALHFAAACKSGLDAIHILLTAGVNVTSATALGVTPLHVACAHGNTPVVDALLRAGASANVVDQYGMTPLHCAAASGCLICVLTVLFASHDASTRDAMGRKPSDLAEASYVADILKCFTRQKPPAACPVPVYDPLTSGSDAVLCMADAVRKMGKIDAARTLYNSVLNHAENESSGDDEHSDEYNSVAGAYWGLTCCELWDNEWNRAMKAVRHVSTSRNHAAFGWCVQAGAALLAQQPVEAERLFSAAHREFCRIYEYNSLYAMAAALGIYRALLDREQLNDAYVCGAKLVQGISHQPIVANDMTVSCTNEGIIILACTCGMADTLGKAVFDMVKLGQSGAALMTAIYGLNAQNAANSSIAVESYQHTLATLRAAGHTSAAQVIEADYRARFLDSSFFAKPSRASRTIHR